MADAGTGPSTNKKVTFVARNNAHPSTGKST